ncbi:hypothetical protein, partial [Acidiphilium sp.]|uniref:hypothetical protein n=1 Tax=Acidiphilium sp. TaxID=527 RepID=UPI003D0634CB
MPGVPLLAVPAHRLVTAGPQQQNPRCHHHPISLVMERNYRPRLVQPFSQLIDKVGKAKDRQ